MNVIRLQSLAGFLLLTWTGLGMAQNAGIDRASIMREGYESLRDSAPNMTAQQQQLFDHKIKELELKQAWESNYTNAAGAKKAVQQADEAEAEEDDIEYFIDE